MPICAEFPDTHGWSEGDCRWCDPPVNFHIHPIDGESFAAFLSSDTFKQGMARVRAAIARQQISKPGISAEQRMRALQAAADGIAEIAANYVTQRVFQKVKDSSVTTHVLTVTALQSGTIPAGAELISGGDVLRFRPPPEEEQDE